MPPLRTIRAITSILGALDDKIVSNRRLARLLERIAQTEFRARFVDFVGVEDRANSGNGPIPSGWHWRAISSLARYVNGKAFTKFGNGRGRMVIRIADLKSGPGGSTVYTDHEPGSDDFIARPGDLLFAWSGSLDVYRWHREEALINQHIFKVVPANVPEWLVYFALKQVMPHFQGIAADKATTMGHIKRSDLTRFGVPFPPQEQLQEFDDFFAPILDLSLGAIIEAESLAGIRDTLLPRLISGQIRVPDITDPSEAIEPLVDEAA
jgi:type I restriction enzyme S subunit